MSVKLPPIYPNMENLEKEPITSTTNTSKDESDVDMEENMDSLKRQVDSFRDQLDREGDRLEDLVRSVDDLKRFAESKTTAANMSPADYPPERPPITEPDLVNYLHKLHASSVPDQRKNFLAEISRKFTVSCRQLGDILAQLRYQSEKELAITIFGAGVNDPENYDDLMGILSGAMYQEKDVLVGCLINTISSKLE